MPSIFKYTSAKYVDRFIRHGEVLFRSLSYFRDLEDEQKKVRGDQDEGTRTLRKPEGLTLRMGTGEVRIFDGSYESNAKTEDIFVLCLSTDLSPSLAHDFGTSTCIEIHNPTLFLAGIRSALKRRPAIKNKLLLHAPVTYYDAADDVGIEWAFPDRIALSKTKHYEGQKEYRIAFGINDALAFQNITERLVTRHHTNTRSYDHPQMLLKVGDLRRCCTVWEFGVDGVPVKRMT